MTKVVVREMMSFELDWNGFAVIMTDLFPVAHGF
jgi:hypothetical protein